MICLSITMLAIIFKISHWPGAWILLIAGLGSSALIFLPTAHHALIKTSDDKLLRFLFTAAFISFGFDFIGMLFKVQHWPYAGILLLIGMPLPFVLFLPVYISYHIKRKLKTDLNFFGIILFMIYLAVFSTLLAISPTKEVLTEYAYATNSISGANEYLSSSVSGFKDSEISKSTEQLVKQIEDTKQKLILAADIDNKSLIKPDQFIDYSQLSGKDMRLSIEKINEEGLTLFNVQFEIFCRVLKEKYPDEMNVRLIREINDYRLPENEGGIPIIAQLPLITVLNVLTDWQNKLLLISYLNSNKNS